MKAAAPAVQGWLTAGWKEARLPVSLSSPKKITEIFNFYVVFLLW